MCSPDEEVLAVGARDDDAGGEKLFVLVEFGLLEGGGGGMAVSGGAAAKEKTTNSARQPLLKTKTHPKHRTAIARAILKLAAAFAGLFTSSRTHAMSASAVPAAAAGIVLGGCAIAAAAAGRGGVMMGAVERCACIN